MTNPQEDMILGEDYERLGSARVPEVKPAKGKIAKGEIGRDDQLPPGPYKVGMMHGPKGELEWPFTIQCGDGRAIAGHVNSRACADAIVAAMNAWSKQ